MKSQLKAAEQELMAARFRMMTAQAGMSSALRDHRESLDISLNAVAESLGVTHGYLSKVERGYKGTPAYIVEHYRNLKPPANGRTRNR